MSAPLPAEAEAARTPVLPLDQGAIGNGRVLALVSPTSAVDWLCLPRFDSPSGFARMLDRDRGGTWRFLARGEELSGRFEYVRNTNVLRNVLGVGEASFELLDFAHARSELGGAEAAWLAIGDDRTDEDLFAALSPGAYGLEVGTGPTCARGRLRSPREVRDLLLEILRGRARRARTSAGTAEKEPR